MNHLVVARVVVEVGAPLGLDVGVVLGGLLGYDIDGDELLEIAEESLPELEILPEVQAGFGLPEVRGYFVVKLHLERQLTTIGLHLSCNKFRSHLFTDPAPAITCCLGLWSIVLRELQFRKVIFMREAKKVYEQF